MKVGNAPLIRERSYFKGDTLSEPERLAEEDQERAGYCRHDKCILKQGISKKTGKAWRGEFCRANVCEPVWWRWNDQMKVWIPPMHEPNDYLYVGWDDKREETREPNGEV